MHKKDCIIVGGGIVGMATARELAMRGLAVSLFDKGRLGKQASFAAGGILSSMRPWFEHSDSAKLSSEGKACYEDYTKALKDETGVDPEFYRSGLLMIDEADLGHAKTWADKTKFSYSEHHKEYPVHMRIPDKSIFFPEIAQIRVSRLLKALRASLVKLDVSIFEDTAITGLELNKGRCDAIITGNGKHCASLFIISAGAWSEKISRPINDDIKIKPVLGQMLCVKFPKQQLKSMILDGAHYFIPRKDGHVLIGSTMEDVGFSKDITQSARNDLMDWAFALWPDISAAKFIKQWAGLRPATGNGIPYLSKFEGYENIYINAGHFRKGILQAPVCARKIADMIFSAD